jgi:nicotinamidase-related amidase
MELQRGVCGDRADAIPQLAKIVANTELVETAVRVCDAARAAGVRVVHCTAEERRDRVGTARNSPLVRMTGRVPGHLEVGTESAALIPALGPSPEDLVVSRLTGLTPFTGTSLDVTLRALGVRTVVAMGVSLNVGLTGMVMSAVDLGYGVVVVRDAVAGVPQEYGQTVLEHTIAVLANVISADEVVAAWS